MTDATVLGRNLKAARGRSGLLLAALAERAHLDTGTIGAIERGEVPIPQAETMRKLAEALGTTAEALLGDSE